MMDAGNTVLHAIWIDNEGVVLYTKMGRQHCIYNNVGWGVIWGMGYKRTESVKVLYTNWEGRIDATPTKMC